MTNPTFAELGLAEPLLRALNDAQYTHPTPIQAKSIPALLDGRDLLGLAETGTGKTAAFVLPLLHRLAAEGGRPQPGAPRALILAPTRELAIQIGDSIATYGRHLRLSHTVIFGGVGQRPQVTAIARGVDILVATPGRLLDLADQRHLRLGNIGTFVLDEADRMLDMGFVRDVRRILKLVPVKRHSLLFSATMPADIARLAAEILKDPVRVEIARAGKTVDRIDQRVMFVSAGAKRDVLGHLLQDPEMRRVIVFTRTKRGADRVCRALEHSGIGVHAIHGNKSQGQRQSALDSFRKGFTRVLVATDIAARGIDIDEITHVVNYELPNLPESYVHRIGRTARAGASGVAIAFCAPDEREYLRDIEKLTGRALAVVASPIIVQRDTSPEIAVNNSDDRGRPAPQRRPVEGRNGGREQHRGDRGARQERTANGRPPARGAGARSNRGPSDERNPGDRRASDRSQDHRRPDSRNREHGRGGPNAAGNRGRDSDAPRNGDVRPAQKPVQNKSRNGDSGAEPPQPWRNWTGGDALHQGRRRPSRHPQASTGKNRRRDGQGGGHASR